MITGRDIPETDAKLAMGEGAFDLHDVGDNLLAHGLWREQVTPLLPRLALGLGVRADRGREFVPPLPRPRGVDDHARVVALGIRRDGWVERAGPGAVDDVERALGVRTGHHGPHHVVEIRDVDVLVYHDDDPA